MNINEYEYNCRLEAKEKHVLVLGEDETVNYRLSYYFLSYSFIYWMPGLMSTKYPRSCPRDYHSLEPRWIDIYIQGDKCNER